MKLFDAHCHLQYLLFNGIHQKIIKNARNVGVKKIAIKSTTQEDWKETERLCLNDNMLIPSFGLHPWFLAIRSDDWEIELEHLLNSYPQACVGEIGIDPNTKGDLGVSMDDQEFIFLKQLVLANQFKRPVSIHCRSSWDKLISLIDQVSPLPAGFMIHCFGGSLEVAQELVKRGAYLSFSGTITRPNNTKAFKVINNIPKNRILIETDAPDLLPHGLDNRLNEPANLLHVLNRASELMNLSAAMLAEQTYINACRFFNIEN